MKTFEGDRPFLRLLGRQLRDAVGAGAALAALGLGGGCGADAEGATDLVGANGGTGGSSTPGNGPDGGAPAPTTPVANLQPYPLDSLGCHGPISESPLYGPQCCFQATCYTPTDGAGCTTEPGSSNLPLQLPSGSGSCGCAVEEEGRAPMTGPHAPNPNAPAPLTPGVCCYVVGSYGCTGRPFVVSGLGRVAGVARRDDWGVSSGAKGRGARDRQG